MQSTSFKSGLVNSIILNVLSKGLVFFVNIIIVNRFKTSEITDIYFFCLTYGVLIVTFFTGMCTTVIIPGMMHLEKANGATASAFLNKLYCQLLVVLLILLTVLFLLPTESFLLLSRFDSAEITRNIPVIRLALIAMFLQCVSSILAELLNSKRFFLLPASVALLNSFLIIVSVYFFSGTENISVVFWSNILAFSISILIQLYLLFWRVKWQFRISDFNTKITSFYYKNLGMTATGNFFSILAAYVPLYLFSGETEGWLTSLSISQRIADIPSALLFFQLSSVLGVRFIELAVIGDTIKLNKFFVDSCNVLLLISVPVSLLVSYFAFETVTVLFGANGINKSTITYSANLLQILALASPFIGINSLISRMFLAVQNIKFAFIYQCGFNFFLAAICVLCFEILGPIGFAIGYVLSYLISFIMISFLLKRIFSFLKYRAIIIDAVKVALFSLVILGIVHVFINWNDFIRSSSIAIRLICSISFYIGLFLTGTYVLVLNRNLNNLLLKYIKGIFSFLHK
jgi:peptidoglycan biosynthesis protein MviN/MurJ (putative lipid II flippase)